MNIDVLGIDIAKNTFQLHGVDHAGKVMLKKRLARAKLTAYIANLPVCTIVVEACGGTNYWARTFMQFGHKVKLISILSRRTASKTVLKSWQTLTNRWSRIENLNRIQKSDNRTE